MLEQLYGDSISGLMSNALTLNDEDYAPETPYIQSTSTTMIQQSTDGSSPTVNGDSNGHNVTSASNGTTIGSSNNNAHVNGNTNKRSIETISNGYDDSSNSTSTSRTADGRKRIRPMLVGNAALDNVITSTTASSSAMPASYMSTGMEASNNTQQQQKNTQVSLFNTWTNQYMYLTLHTQLHKQSCFCAYEGNYTAAPYLVQRARYLSIRFAYTSCCWCHSKATLQTFQILVMAVVVILSITTMDTMHNQVFNLLYIYDKQ